MKKERDLYQNTIWRKKINEGKLLLLFIFPIGEIGLVDVYWSLCCYHRRIYQDESFIKDNDLPSKGCSEQGAPINRVENKFPKKYTFTLAISTKGLVGWPFL